MQCVRYSIQCTGTLNVWHLYDISMEVQNLVNNYITDVLCNTMLSRRAVLCTVCSDNRRSKR